MTREIKSDYLKNIPKVINSLGLRISSYDVEKPWGGFFVIDENQAQKFANIYFDGKNIQDLQIAGKLSPKILAIQPHSKLSWQYHHRRSETWRVIEGPVGIIRSMSDIQTEVEILKKGDVITLKNKQRHRLIGQENWALVAEFWQHTDKRNPSNEEDIIRIEDDYQR